MIRAAGSSVESAGDGGREIAARYPFTAVVGQGPDFKLALILSAISPGIGGVLIRGEKPPSRPSRPGPVADGRVVELPIGATEDRVVGSLDLTGVLREGRADFTPVCLPRPTAACLHRRGQPARRPSRRRTARCRSQRAGDHRTRRSLACTQATQHSYSSAR